MSRILLREREAYAKQKADQLSARGRRATRAALTPMRLVDHSSRSSEPFQRLETSPPEGHLTKGGGGVHLLLETDKEEISIHLGPAWFIDKQAMKIAAEDTIEVHGSRIALRVSSPSSPPR